MAPFIKESPEERGKIGYAVLYLLGAPLGLLVILWFFLGNNIFTSG